MYIYDYHFYFYTKTVQRLITIIYTKLQTVLYTTSWLCGRNPRVVQYTCMAVTLTLKYLLLLWSCYSTVPLQLFPLPPPPPPPFLSRVCLCVCPHTMCNICKRRISQARQLPLTFSTLRPCPVWTVCRFPHKFSCGVQAQESSHLNCSKAVKCASPVSKGSDSRS